MPDEHRHVSTRLRRLVCKEAIASPQGHGSECGLKVLSAGFRSSLLSEGNCYLHPGRGGLALLGHQSPRLWIKLRRRGSWGRGGSRLPSTFRPAKVKHTFTCHVPSLSLTQIRFLSHQVSLAFPQWPESQYTFNRKTTRLAQSDPPCMATWPASRGMTPQGRDLLLGNCSSI